MTSPRFFALIPAAGVGARLGSACPKQYLTIGDKPMLLHVLDAFASSPMITHTFVIVSSEDDWISALLLGAPHLANRVTVLYQGGATRQESVRNGLQAIELQLDGGDWILVHDAARPGVTQDLIARLIAVLCEDDVGGLPALPIVDTIKRAGYDSRIQATVPRQDLWGAQTPQMFRYALLRQALAQSGEFTDEASAVEALGLQPKLIEGCARNLKVTRPADVVLAEYFLKN